MGRKYTETGVTCWKCLDKSNNAFGYEAGFLNANGLLVIVQKVSLSFVSGPFERNILI
jgi:hypothetical protein